MVAIAMYSCPHFLSPSFLAILLAALKSGPEFNITAIIVMMIASPGMLWTTTNSGPNGRHAQERPRFDICNSS
ncbi:hypothetical protein WJX77_012093 [Trebouxia sp. C0004]